MWFRRRLAIGRRMSISEDEELHGCRPPLALSTSSDLPKPETLESCIYLVWAQGDTGSRKVSHGCSSIFFPTLPEEVALRFEELCVK